MELLKSILTYARETGCSDIHLNEGSPAMVRRNGILQECPFFMDENMTKECIMAMIPKRLMSDFQNGKDTDFTYTLDSKRQRVNIYRQQGKLCAAIRIIHDTIQTLDELQMPEILKKLTMEPRGLIIVSGPTGSGKSTTLAAMVGYINEHRKCHILTIEDPIEYVYAQKQALIHQREIGQDVDTFDTALRSALREDPDVILVGEMRDYETIAAVVTLAETGHLVLSSLHTAGAAKTIDRIIDVFPAHRQDQVRMQIAGVLKAVITQQLLVTKDQCSRTAALEIMIVNDAIHNLIREKKIHQINTIIQTGMREGMQSLNLALARLIKNNVVTFEEASNYSNDTEELKQFLR